MIKPLPAIYKLENTTTGEFYIGGTRNVQNRRWHHFVSLREGKHGNPKIQFDYNKGDKLNLIVLEYLNEGSTDDFIVNREQQWMDMLHPTYNFKRAVPLEENDRLHRKRKLANTEPHVQTEEERRKRSNSVKRYWATHEPKTISEEHRKRISDKISGNKHPLFGTHVSDSTRAKLEISNSKIEYIFKNSDGVDVVFINLRKWCKENSMSEPCLRDVQKGNRKQYKGWTFVSKRKLP